MRLLVVEDETAIAEPLTEALCCVDESYEITRAATLDRATRLADRVRFDAALVDLTLPDAADCDIVHALRRTSPDLPIVALTGRDFETVGLPLARAGVQDYLRKGIDSIERIHQSLLLAIERQRQKVVLQQKTCYDELTGVMNRREIEVQLEKAVSHAARSGQCGAVMLVNLDDLREINVAHGHDAGDAVLRALAARITKTLRTGDSVGRLGGSEFVIVVEGLKNPGHAMQVAEKVLEACRSATFNGSQVKVSASIGIAVFPTEGTSWSALLRLADTDMYLSKRNGKVSVRGAKPTMS